MIQQIKKFLKYTSIDVAVYALIIAFFMNFDIIVNNYDIYSIFCNCDYLQTWVYALVYSVVMCNFSYIMDRLLDKPDINIVTYGVMACLILLDFVIYFTVLTPYMTYITHLITLGIVITTFFYEKFKKRYGVLKGLYVGVTAVFNIVVVPMLIMGLDRNIGSIFQQPSLIKSAILMLNCFVGSTMRDIPDIVEDKEKGILTVPSILGKTNTVLILYGVLGACLILSVLLTTKLQIMFWIVHILLTCALLWLNIVH
ncbi:putative UbiA prenyltransferase [Yasminevirus sp. GU-2018]|uniref:Putative UbiA prenyltransferase n=1 Tax=Yasminevirus sp. GU-2018 TaxID=2420051 RepID=A0A5K0U8J6_9VIRU|nr:putative UbiA prenyltransferase [Yasminevirus sp. GU-2018]